MLGAAGVRQGEGLGGGEAAPLEGGLDGGAQGRAQRAERAHRGLPERRLMHQPGSGPWPPRNLRQSAGRFSWKEAIPSCGSAP